MREEQKDESGKKKICVMIAAILAFIYTGIFWFFFKLHEDAARSRNTYACSFVKEDKGDSTIISE